MLNGYLYLAKLRQTHCWTFESDVIHFPGLVKRTLVVQGGPHGHFCPECGHSLRYPHYHGEGRPIDNAPKGLCLARESDFMCLYCL